ncbi:hypothetical protein ACXDJG_005588, partial [Klebsiella pneumoniae]
RQQKTAYYDAEYGQETGGIGTLLSILKCPHFLPGESRCGNVYQIRQRATLQNGHIVVSLVRRYRNAERRKNPLR